VGDHSWVVSSASFSPDGSKVVSGSQDGIVKVWDGTTGQLLWTGKHSNKVYNCVYSVSFSPDGSKVVSGSYEEVKVWETATGKLLWTGNNYGNVYSVSFSPDGSKVVSGSDDYTVQVWEATTGQLLWEGSYHNAVYSVSFSPDGSKVVSGGTENTVTVWTNKKQINLITPNGGEIWAGKSEREISWTSPFVINVKIEYTTDNGTTWQTIVNSTLASLGKYTWTIPEVNSDKCKIRISDADDSNILDVSSNTFTIKIIKEETWALLWTGNHSDAISSVSFSPDGRKVVSGARDRTVKVWDAITGQLLWKGNHNSFVSSVSFSPDGRKVVSGGGAVGNVKVWDSITGELLWTGNYEATVNSVSFSPDGSKVVSGSSDNKVKVWDATTGQLLWKGNHYNLVSSVSFSPDGSKVVSGAWDRTVKVWDSTTGQLLWTGDHYSPVSSVSFSPDGSKVVSGSEDLTVKVWDGITGQFLWKGYHNGSVFSVSFSPDGSKVVSGSEDQTVKVWDSTTGKLLWAGNHNGRVSSVSFSPDGSKVVSGAWDRTVKVWDGTTGQLLWTGKHYDFVNSVSFSSDGSKVVSGGRGRTLKVWANKKQINLITPNGGELLTDKTKREISWTSSFVINVKIEYTTDNGTTWQTISSSTPASSGNYTWTIPEINSDECKIKITDADDNNIYDESDNTFTIIMYNRNLTINTSYNFSNYTETSDFRIIGLPGDINISVSELFPNQEVRENWKVFWDNGEDYNYQLEYDNSSIFFFRPGRAFWVISKNDIVFKRTVDAVNLDIDGTYSIPLHKSWNLISNPFDKSISWEDVKTINGITQPIWDFEGSYSEVSNFEPYKGYYFYNAADLTQLKIPYISSIKKLSLNKKSNESLIAKLSLYKDNYKIASVRICINENAADTLDEFDIFSPGVNKEDINFINNNKSPRKRYQKADFRSKIKDKNEYKIEIVKRNNECLRLTVDENFTPMGLYLIDEEAKMIFDLERSYEIPNSIKKKVYKLILTTEEEIEKIKQKYLPKEYYLSQNYPKV
jgi:WD40 repeat protein